MANITQVATVFIPVTDHERALGFYVDALGCEVVNDFAYDDGYRWLEVQPPGAATRISLVSSVDVGVETGVALLSGDVEADRAALAAAGADVDDALQRAGDPEVLWAGARLAGIPPMFRVRDPDGNSLLVVSATP
jgi:catechol 2,3-dioxygenase-like lactoylglutathione lyase family enzyme